MIEQKSQDREKFVDPQEHPGVQGDRLQQDAAGVTDQALRCQMQGDWIF